MPESRDSLAEEIASAIAGGASGGEPFPESWIRFQMGTLPGIHSGRWPAWVPGELIPILSRDERAVSVLFSGKEGAPEWVPSWHRDAGHPVIAFINENPSILPRLHALLSAASTRRALPLLISSAERGAALDFLTQDILSKALYILPRTPLPSLDRWIGEDSSEWPGVEGMALRGASILMAAIAEAPRSYRNQVLLSLPKIAGDLDSFQVPEPPFRNAAKDYVLRCAPLAGDSVSSNDRAK